MHCDISTGNIILFADTTSSTYGNRRGILIDWELSRKVEEADERRYWRTGTFAFKSIEGLNSNPGPHALVHDAESLVYVVFYCAISYLKWTYSAINHQGLLNTFFNQAQIKVGEGDSPPYLVGGAGKVCNLWPRSGRAFAQPRGLPTVIQEWLRRSLEPIISWNESDPLDRTAEVQRNMARPIFGLSGDVFADMPNNDREFHERPNIKFVY